MRKLNCACGRRGGWEDKVRGFLFGFQSAAPILAAKHAPINYFGAKTPGQLTFVASKDKPINLCVIRQKNIKHTGILV